MKAATEEGGDEQWFLHNHARFTILYHKDIETDLARIVGFEAGPARLIARHIIHRVLHPQPGRFDRHTTSSSALRTLVSCGERHPMTQLGGGGTSARPCLTVEPASVKHGYATWDEVMPQLDTCTAGAYTRPLLSST